MTRDAKRVEPWIAALLFANSNPSFAIRITDKFGFVLYDFCPSLRQQPTYRFLCNKYAGTEQFNSFFAFNTFHINFNAFIPITQTFYSSISAM